ncbi:hypothetical protein P4110_18540 [Pseudomonas aeruginosa]|nr:hypothetical protein [Pseudomonas aeruginosa]
MNGLHALRLGSLSLRWRPRRRWPAWSSRGSDWRWRRRCWGTGSLALGPAEVFASLLGQGRTPPPSASSSAYACHGCSPPAWSAPRWA